MSAYGSAIRSMSFRYFPSLSMGSQVPDSRLQLSDRRWDLVRSRRGWVILRPLARLRSSTLRRIGKVPLDDSCGGSARTVQAAIAALLSTKVPSRLLPNCGTG